MHTGQTDGVKKNIEHRPMSKFRGIVPILLQNSHLSEISEMAVLHQMYYNQFWEN